MESELERRRGDRESALHYPFRWHLYRTRESSTPIRNVPVDLTRSFTPQGPSLMTSVSAAEKRSDFQRQIAVTMSLPTLLDKLSATKHTWQGCKNLRSRNFVKRCKSCQCQPTQPFLRPNRETETETALSRVPSHFPHSGLRRAGAALSGGDYGLAVFVLPPISDSAAAARAWVDPPPTTPSEGGREREGFSRR